MAPRVRLAQRVPLVPRGLKVLPVLPVLPAQTGLQALLARPVQKVLKVRPVMTDLPAQMDQLAPRDHPARMVQMALPVLRVPLALLVLLAHKARSLQLGWVLGMQLRCTIIVMLFSIRDQVICSLMPMQSVLGNRLARAPDNGSY